MTNRFGKAHIESAEFRGIFLEFASPGINDKWPSDYPDKVARGLPKDGATVVFAEGIRAKGAAKLLNGPSSYHWPGTGTRHEAALATAEHVGRVIVLIRSDSGLIHCVLGSFKGRAYKLA